MSSEAQRGEDLHLELSFGDILVTALNIKLLRANPNLPLSLVVRSVQPTVSTKRSIVIYNVEYDFFVEDREGLVAWEMTCTLTLLFTPKRDVQTNELTSFGGRLLEMAHPYLTELVHSMTQRMGVPPLLIEIFKAGQ